MRPFFVVWYLFNGAEGPAPFSITERKHKFMQIITGRFVFDPEDVIYADHFPGHGVVPGSLIVHAFLKALHGPQTISKTVQVEDFRFKHFIPPGDYDFAIENAADKTGPQPWSCRLMDRGRLVAAGTIVL